MSSPYRPDRPHDISSPDEDVFGHGGYADALVKTLTEADTPFTVGMFGEWGVGKSTILGAVRGKLKEKNVAFAFFDAWRYEGDALRRQFLKDIARQLDDEEQLVGFEVEKELRDLDVEFSKPQDSRLTVSVPELQRAGITFGVGFILLFVLLRIHATGSFFTGAKAPSDAVLALVSALFVSAVTTLTQPLKVEQQILTTRRVEEPDQFTEKFEQLMAAVKAKRVVIAIDNLDRCSPEHAVEVLSTIKTYLEPSLEREPTRRFLARFFEKEPKEAVFLVAADRDALRRHLLGQERKRSDGTDLAHAEQYVEEYLRKFFSAVIPIRELLDDDVRRFVGDRLASVTKAHGAESDLSVLTQMCSTGLRGNPRRVNQFANNLELRLSLLAARELAPPGGKPQIEPPISDQLLMVAKLLMIEEEWPHSFSELLVRPRLLEVWEIRARETSSDDAENRPEGVGEHDWERLAAFLRAASGVRAANLRAFLHLKQSLEEVALPGYSEFRDAVTAGDRDAVEQIVTEGGQPVEKYAERLTRLLTEEAQEHYYQGARAVIDAAVSVPAFRNLPTAGDVIAAAYEDPQLRRELVEVEPEAVLGVAAAHLSEGRERLVQSLFAAELVVALNESRQASRAQELAQGLAGVTKLAPDARAALEGFISESPGRWSEIAPLLKAHTELLTTAVVTEALRTMASAAPDSLPASEISSNADAQRLVELATEASLVSAERFDELVRYFQQQLTPAIWQNVSDLVTRLDAQRQFLELMPDALGHPAEPRPSSPQLAELSQHLRAFGTPPDSDDARVALLRYRHAIWRLIDDDVARSQLAVEAAADFLNHHAANALAEIASRSQDLVFIDELAIRIGQLASQQPSLASSAASALVSAFPDKAPALISQAIVDLARSGHAPTSIDMLRTHLPELQAQASSLAASLIGLGQGVTPQTLPLLTVLADYLGAEDVDSLRDMLMAEIDGLPPDRLGQAIEAITAFGANGYFTDALETLIEALVIHLGNVPQFDAARAGPVWTFLTNRWGRLGEPTRRQVLDYLRRWLRDTPQVVPHLESGIASAASVSREEAGRFMDALLDTDGLVGDPATRGQLLRVAARIAGPRNAKTRRRLEERLKALEESGDESLKNVVAHARAELS